MRSLLCLFTLALVLAQLIEASSSSSPYDDDEEIPADLEEMLRRDPTFVLGMLTKLRSRILKPLENNKRGIDFGLGRGYSGNQAAKHFMGLVASQYAGGPGKRKRMDPEMQDYQLRYL